MEILLKKSVGDDEVVVVVSGGWFDLIKLVGGSDDGSRQPLGTLKRGSCQLHQSCPCQGLRDGSWRPFDLVGDGLEGG